MSTRSTTKRKVSVTLDEDLLQEVGQEAGSLSAAVNLALRSDLERRRHQRALERLLDRLAAEDGPLGSLDEPEIARFMRLLGGPHDAHRA